MVTDDEWYDRGYRCHLAGPDCRGHVRQFMNYKACTTHGPPPQPIPDPTRNATAIHERVVAETRERTAREAAERNDGMALLRAAAEGQRDQAMAQVDGAATDQWKDQARRAIWWLANNRATFTVDDVWERLESAGVASPDDPRALGPVLMRALRAGAIRDTGQMAKSRRRHASKITVYALNRKDQP